MTQDNQIDPSVVILKCMAGDDLTWQEYCAGASRTLANPWHGDKYPLNVALGIIYNYIDAARMLDVLKRCLFYGGLKDVSIERCVEEHIKFNVDNDQFLPELYEGKIWDEMLIDPRIVHSIIGMATEAGELVEALYIALMRKEEIDIVNFVEELGDFDWYRAIPYTLAGGTENLSPVWRKNLLKLYERYGDKFSAERAINRNLEAEREVLERGFF